MTIKSPPPQTVRLLPRADPAPAGAGRQRALRQQFKSSYTSPQSHRAPKTANQTSST